MEEKGKIQDGLVARPPIVAVLGHVDHGKTSLLDKIRQTRIAEREAGGITQKIGAYQIDFQGKKITFIDTPGHEAFSAMRSRGAKIADIAVLVVSAVDGVMPQTIESINHIQSAKIPFIVAINKTDLPSADSERIKEQLSQNGVNTEDYGGEIVCVPVSAKTGNGIKDLLDMILLLAEMNNINADPKGSLSGVIIESKKDQRGSVGTVVIKNGTLKVGEAVKTSEETFKAKGIFDQDGKSVSSAEPGKPVELLGFTAVPAVGGEILSSDTSVFSKASDKYKKEMLMVDDGQARIRMIIKADSQGSLEAIMASLPTEVLIIESSIGDVTDSEVLLAKSSKAEIWGFNVKVPSQVRKLAESERINIYSFQIIYEFLEQLENKILKFIEPTIDEQILGKAGIIAQFDINGQIIAGCRVLDGRINKSDNLHLKRGEKIIADTKISSLRHRKEEINEVIVGDEFGIVFSGPLDFKVGDVIIAHK